MAVLNGVSRIPFLSASSYSIKTNGPLYSINMFAAHAAEGRVLKNEKSFH
jgi:hypothetical protein